MHEHVACSRSGRTCQLEGWQPRTTTEEVKGGSSEDGTDEGQGQWVLAEAGGKLLKEN